jgi:hypothetical protein
MYRRGNTLFEHQQLACEVLDFHWLSEGQRRILSGAIRLELTRTRDSEQLLIFARRWLYEHRLLIMHERAIRSTIAKVRQHFEVSLAKSIRAAVGDAELERWRKALVTPRESGVTQQSWFWAPPAKHSTRQIEELLERIATLYELGIQRHFADVPDDLLRRYARRLANRPPSIGARIKEPLRTIESVYFLRYCLLIGTDRLLLMVRRRVADLWRRASTDGTRVVVHWADMYRELLASLASLASDSTLAESEIRERLQSLVAEHKKRKPPTRAQLVRDQLTLEIRPVRSLLSGLMVLPWDATADHPVLAAVRLLKSLYEQGVRELPADTEISWGSKPHPCERFDLRGEIGCGRR